MKKFFEIIKNKWLLKGTTTIALVAIVIGIYILLNWGVEKLNLENLDFTSEKLYTLSDETKSKIKDIDEQITIQLINVSTNYAYVSECAKNYTKINDNITIEEINDLSSRTDLMTKYDIDTDDMLIVIKVGDNEKTLDESDLYEYDYSTYETNDTTEESITNAIVELTLEEKPQIYILSGKTYYNTSQVLYNLIDQLEADSNEVNYLDILSTGSVPEDCDCLIITTLSEDLSELERDKIIEYIQNGGNLMILTSQNVLDIDTPNFNTVLAEYGILPIEYGAIFEQDTSKMLQNSPEMALVDASASFMSNIDMNLKMCVIDAGSIEFSDDDTLSELGVEYEVIAETGETSFIRTNFNLTTSSRTDEDSEEGSYIVGALATKTISDDVTSELVIYSNEICVSNMVLTVSAQYQMYASSLYNNEDVVLNSISYLTERTDTITIRKIDDSQTYTVTDQQDTIIKMIVFITPVVIIIVGIIIWQVRRRKK